MQTTTQRKPRATATPANAQGVQTSIQKAPKPRKPRAAPNPANAQEKLSGIDKLPDSAFIREAQLVSTASKPGLLPICSATLWRYSKEGKFPKPRKLSTRVTVWNIGEVRAWMAAQNAAR
jgi:prophage regulatory protein